MARVLGLVLAVVFATACDSDGCRGGPNGDATAYCQSVELTGGPDAGPAQLAANCRSCCRQEVVYRGVVERGRCVCH